MSLNKARTPWFPTYAYAAALYSVLPGVALSTLRALDQAIAAQMGTAANPVDWSRPDEWIQQRLTGDVRDLALHIWQGTGGLVNPRYTAGSMMLARTHALVQDAGGVYALTTAGEAFVAKDGDLIQVLDESEGLLQALVALSGFETVTRKDLLPEWVEALGGDSRSENTLSGLLYDRLVNLVDRDLVERVGGKKYRLTASGRVYIERVQPREVSQRRRLDEAAREYRAQQRAQLRELLGKMHPYRFEHLIRELLAEMGYEDTTVTQQSGDKGIDVVATAKFGITTVKEVVQVKRVAGTTGRPVIDQLRGVLPLHGAIRGTVITLGTFAAGAKDVAVFVGAAPITLIDGETLIDLLIEHEVGVVPRTVPVYDVDEAFFSEEAPGVDDAG
ncbi:restriction endonuclease [Deinococcus soli (ex Cha et al. 2016)]|uniref:restriction endonuclease n=1 Tax=Deinococcus soli (ex Cha et al. 2016) TaxID=1309411 RepID=UPI00166DD4D5|nr:restriction endonuclease [Deinococcus soli (ex Cha et al. 2016)]GGB54968.1 hypothetical protein GCM10008019_08350 [Deinococcus soli (ex Cha et al. 2016)]